MEQGNPNKIDAIIEEIVKNNSIFKLKSPIEQEKEKALMAKSINSALSVLNEAGKELVLQDLSVDPDEKFKGFIDSVGNIDISGITQYTASIVKVKIEEAEREGINLRRDAVNVTKDNQTISAEDVISMTIVSNMILKYETLSDGEKAKLLDKELYRKLSDEDRRRLNDKIYESAISRNLSENQRKKVEELRREQELNEAYIEVYKRNPHITTPEELSEEIKKYFPKFSDKEIIRFCKKNHKIDRRASENIDFAMENAASLNGSIEAIRIISDYNLLIQQGKLNEAEKLLFAFKDKIPEIEQVWNEMNKNGKFVEWNESEIEELKSQGVDTQEVVFEGNERLVSQMEETENSITQDEFDMEEQIANVCEECQIDFKVENFVQREIKVVSQLLLKDGISREQINNSIVAYKEIMEQLPEKYISEIEECHGDDRDDFIKDLLVKMCHVEAEIAEKLSKMKFDGQLIDMLKNEDRRAEFIEQLGQSIEQIKGPEVANESPNQGVLDAQPIPEEVAAELQAIPVALQRINCQPEDIAKGMEAYKQIIDGLSPEEIEGTQETITQTLKKKVEELELDGNAADILKMMSQITFNGQISEILKNCKGEFLNSLETLSMQGPLLDPRVYAGNPEQNNSNSSNSSSLTERVDEDTLKAGFEALAVDLQIADPTIIRPEELVTDENTQLENGQEENTELPRKEARKEKAEGAVISKLQAFFGVYRNAGMIEVQEVSEEIKEIVQELDLNLQNNNVHRVEEEIKNDEGIEQG